jgi:hypothetical protein
VEAPLSERPSPSGRLIILRQAIILALGAFVLIDASLDHADNVVEWIVGLVLVGIVPVEAVFAWWHSNGHNGHQGPPAPPSTP